MMLRAWRGILCLLLSALAWTRAGAFSPGQALDRVRPQRDSVVLWEGDTVRLDSALTTGASDATDAGTWWSTDARVAVVTKSGEVVARRAGRANIVRQLGDRTWSTLLVVLPSIRGELLPADGGSPGSLSVAAFARGLLDSATSDPTGRFRVRLSRSPGSAVRVEIGSPTGGAGAYHVAILTVAPDVLPETLRVVLIPTRWEIPGGAHAGRIVRISAAAAIAKSRDGRRFCRLSDGGDVVGWPADAFPLPIAFRRATSTERITAADSAHFWATAEALQRQYGATLFRPASLREAEDDGRAIVVDVEAPIRSEGFTFITWSASGDVFDGRVILRTAGLLGDEFVVAHELMHVLGFDHTNAWLSVLTPGRRQAALTAEDVAYAQLLYRVRELQRRRRAAYGLLEAADGERGNLPAEH